MSQPSMQHPSEPQVQQQMLQPIPQKQPVSQQQTVQQQQATQVSHVEHEQPTIQNMGYGPIKGQGPSSVIQQRYNPLTSNVKQTTQQQTQVNNETNKQQTTNNGYLPQTTTQQQTTTTTQQQLLAAQQQQQLLAAQQQLLTVNQQQTQQQQQYINNNNNNNQYYPYTTNQQTTNTIPQTQQNTNLLTQQTLTNQQQLQQTTNNPYIVDPNNNNITTAQQLGINYPYQLNTLQYGNHLNAASAAASQLQNPAINQLNQLSNMVVPNNNLLLGYPNPFNPLGTPIIPRSNPTGITYSLFVFHLPEDIDDHGLLTLFAPFGAIRAIVMRHDTGRSRGFGFVHFNTKHEAQIAIDMMNGHQIGRKILKVSFKKDDQKKNEIKLSLENALNKD